MDIYDRIFALADPYLQTRSNLIHTAVARRFAAALLLREPGDPEIAIPAILLHDVGWSALTEEMQLQAFGPGHVKKDKTLNRVHETEGVKIARQILAQVHYDDVKSEEILQIIDGHDSRLTPISDNDKIVKDADKLFRFSAEGLDFYLARFEMTPAEIVQWLQTRIEVWFFTAAARKIAAAEWEQRHRSLA